MRVTLRDVAERAGCSASTACRALADHEHIHPATRARVLAAAQELNYVPNRLARSLVRKRSELIGFVLFDVAHPFFAGVTRGIEDVTGGAGYDLVLSCSYRNQQQERNAVNLLSRLQADGFIITPVLEATDHLTQAQKSGLRLVVVGRTLIDLGFASVSVDDHRAGLLVTSHLLALGHRTIGAVAGGHVGNRAEQQRILGYRQALAQAGVAHRPELEITVGANDIAAGRRAADLLLERGDLPRALMATNDLLAMGLLHRLRERGLSVPDDVAITGFDDIEFAEYAEVPLTTVRLPQFELGRRAAALLLDMLNEKGPEGPVQILLEPQLIVRKSCGA